MKELSVSDVMALEPCYSKEEIEEVFDGKDKLSLLDILDLDIPAEDKVWVLMRPGVLSDAILREFAALTIDRAVRQNCLTCGIPKVEAWAVKWLDGSDRSAEAARAAYHAAYYAACDAACRAAYYAACDAAEAAACSAAEAAACSAAEAAARKACGVAYEAAERRQQVDDLRRLIDA